MISLHLTRGDNYEGVYLRLPATPAEVGEAYAMLDSISRYAGETRIVDVKSPVKNLAQFIKNADLAKQEELEKLNRLAEKIGSMSASKQTLLSGALCTESINGLDDVLRVADQLEDYEIIPEVTCDRELGGYVVEHGLIMDFPEAVQPYLDYVGIGAEYYADHGGAYTMDGYVKRRDGQPEQAPEHTVFSAYLRSHCGAKRLLFYFPAAEEALENAKQRLQIDSFAEAEVEALDCDIPLYQIAQLTSLNANPNPVEGSDLRNLAPPSRRKRHIACDEIFMLRIKISSRAHSAAPRSRTGFAPLDFGSG